MNLLLELSLRGAALTAVVALLDRLLANHLSARVRRLWWALVPVAFLVVIPLPVLPVGNGAALPGWLGTRLPVWPSPAATSVPAPSHALELALAAVWLAGMAVWLLAVAMQTRTACRHWSRQRLSTDANLLGMLEDAKASLGVTAPIGLVVSPDLTAPAILGWLRPRLLLPVSAAALPSRQVRAILLHELAHFRSLDVPLNWLFTLARAVHWFNPVVHLAARGWAAIREEAADESALRALGGSAPAELYGQALLAALRPAGVAAPFGAIGIGESIHHLKRRLLMLNRHPRRSHRPFGAILILVALAGAALLHPVRAQETDSKQVAVAAMQTWLAEMDDAHFDQSWKDAAPSFQKAVTSDQWVSMSNSVRSPLGKCTGRQLASALEQNSVPKPGGGTIPGDFMIAQFDTSFENLKYAVETVCFEKTPDGTWKASGYYIKPKS